MPQQKDSLVFRFRKWLGINYDGLFAFRERTRIAFRQLTCRMCDFVLAPKGRKPKRTFQPVIETLEVRQVPASYTWTGGGINSNWTNPANWSGGGGTLTPSSGDDVAITSGFVNLDTAIQIDTLTMSGGSLNLGNKLTLDSGTSTLSGGTVGSNIEVGSSAILNWTGGTVSATLAVDGGATLGISGTSSKSLAGEIDNGGHIAWTQGMSPFPKCLPF